MAIFYRGAAIDTWWHKNDPRISGFLSHSPGIAHTVAQLMNHISFGTTKSPYVSLTRSYGIALGYAMLGKTPTVANPAFVWEIDLTLPLPSGVILRDPVQEVAASLPQPFDVIPYQHDGEQKAIIGLIDGDQYNLATAPVPRPPNSNPSKLGATFTLQFKTLIFALRDAEILAHGPIPAACVTARHEVHQTPAGA
jgi:hypothetical protein